MNFKSSKCLAEHVASLGGRLYLVGGAVRDKLRGAQVFDDDYVIIGLAPERTLYDAFQAEAEKRGDRTVEEWLIAERQAVWSAARDYAQAHNLRVPTIAEVQTAESYARCYAYYGSKWALYVAECMRKVEP